MTRITIREAMDQIESLKHHCKAMAAPDADGTWERDVTALDAAHFALELLAAQYGSADVVMGAGAGSGCRRKGVVL